MQCSIIPETCQDTNPMVEGSGLPGLCEPVLDQLAGTGNLELSARACGALRRRREVCSPMDLLWLVLAYSVCDWPLRLAALRFSLLHRGSLSMTAARQRLRHSVRWLGFLLGGLLHDSPCNFASGTRLRLMDATVICRPGSQGTDWRVHLSLDMESHCLAGIEVTDAHGAETLARFPVQAGEIRVGDRGYARASGLGPVLQAQGQVAVRISWRSLHLEDEAGRALDVAAWLRQSFAGTMATAQERDLWLPTAQGRFAVRLIGWQMDAQSAEAARQRARKAGRKKGYTVDSRTLLAAGFVLVLTNLPAQRWSAMQVLELYRLRWQIETHIKRLKSLLNLDGLRARDPELAQAYLLGKLLGAVWVERMQGQLQRARPEWWTDAMRPINHWSVTRLAWEALAENVRGSVPWTQMVRDAVDLKRFLCDEPRQRRPQWQTAHSLLHGLPSCQGAYTLATR